MGDSFGIYNAFFSFLAFIILIVTLIMQMRDAKKRQLIDSFFKMVDLHSAHLERLTTFPIMEKEDFKEIHGEKAFVQFKIQIECLLESIRSINEELQLNLTQADIADIAYVCFYFGVDERWKENLKAQLSAYESRDKLVEYIINEVRRNKNYRLGRVNQNSLSCYYRTMYNAIRMIDESTLLSKNEKYHFVKILRSQLSNAELYVLFFNLLSRFGATWKEQELVTRYNLVQNIPEGYCSGYDPKDFFPNIKYEFDERKRSPYSE